MGNDVINNDVVLDNDLLQGFVHANRVLRREASYGFAGEGNSLNNYFCSDGWLNSQMLYNVSPVAMRLNEERSTNLTPIQELEAEEAIVCGVLGFVPSLLL